MNWNSDWTNCASIVHLAVTWYLVGLIWVIQRVQYPAMEFVDPEPARAMAAEKQHCERIFWVVGPMMLIEGALATWLLLVGLQSGQWLLPVCGICLSFVIWLSTAVVQMPLHDRMLRGQDRGAQRRLVSTNWLRTVCWSARGLIALAMVMSGF
jgi:hypothetical protein